MPLYTYHCSKCENHETRLVKSSESSGEAYKCSECGGELIRIFDQSGTNFILKGDWFKTSGKY